MSSRRLARLEEKYGKLIAAQKDEAKAKRRFEKYENDPIGFMVDILKFKPWSRQVEIAHSVMNHPLTSVQAGVGAGKDAVAAALSLWFIYCKPDSLVLTTSATQRQVETIMVRGEIGPMWRRAKLPGELFSSALRLPDGRTGLLGHTSGDVSKLTGHHADHVLVVISECQEVSSEGYEAALSCAIGEDDRVLIVGNPLSPEGEFFEASRPGSGWNVIQISLFEHPNIVEGRTVIKGGPTLKGINRFRDKYGVNSGTYLARILGVFPESATDSLVTREWLEAAVDRFEKRTLHEEALKEDWMVGVDVARYGDDLTVMVFRRGGVLMDTATWSQADTMTTVGYIIEELRKRHLVPNAPTNPLLASSGPSYGPGIATASVSIFVDVVGLGSGVYDRLAEQDFPVYESTGGARPRDPQRFVNRRTELYWELRRKFEHGEIALERDEELFEELLNTKYQVSSQGGRIQLERKKDLKKRLKRSPDKSDALAIAFGNDDYTSGGGDLIYV